jgi:hypothetical protein
MEMTRARVRVLLSTAWVAVGLVLIYVARVPPWLVFLAIVAGGAVIDTYAAAVPEGPLSRSEKALRMVAYVLLGTVAAVFILLLAVTMLAFLVAWLAGD